MMKSLTFWDYDGTLEVLMNVLKSGTTEYEYIKTYDSSDTYSWLQLLQLEVLELLNTDSFGNPVSELLTCSLRFNQAADQHHVDQYKILHHNPLDARSLSDDLVALERDERVKPPVNALTVKDIEVGLCTGNDMTAIKAFALQTMLTNRVKQNIEPSKFWMFILLCQWVKARYPNEPVHVDFYDDQLANSNSLMSQAVKQLMHNACLIPIGLNVNFHALDAYLLIHSERGNGEFFQKEVQKIILGNKSIDDFGVFKMLRQTVASFDGKGFLMSKTLLDNVAFNTFSLKRNEFIPSNWRDYFHVTEELEVHEALSELIDRVAVPPTPPNSPMGLLSRSSPFSPPPLKCLSLSRSSSGSDSRSTPGI
jgi:hypothetical protein